jgi:hypothetical protein
MRDSFLLCRSGMATLGLLMIDDRWRTYIDK